MTDDKNISTEIKNRLLFFQNQVLEQFSFLPNFGYSLDKVESGQTDNFKDYFSTFKFSNGETVIRIHFSTDIINGAKTAFPNVKDKELPIMDNLISCSISDKIAFMSMHRYIETTFPEILEDFMIKLCAPNLEAEVTRVTKKYANFFETNLISVLQKKLIYDCYTDRFNDKVFEEIHYR
ncbi:hypothetical protein D3C87_84540 [compost metagenome]